MSEEESKGSKSSSTQDTIENFRKLKEAICADVDSLIFGFPKYRGLRHAAYIIGIVFEGGHIHTLYPQDKTLAIAMLKRMTIEMEKVSKKES